MNFEKNVFPKALRYESTNLHFNLGIPTNKRQKNNSTCDGNDGEKYENRLGFLIHSRCIHMFRLKKISRKNKKNIRLFRKKMRHSLLSLLNKKEFNFGNCNAEKRNVYRNNDDEKYTPRRRQRQKGFAWFNFVTAMAILQQKKDSRSAENKAKENLMQRERQEEKEGANRASGKKLANIA